MLSGMSESVFRWAVVVLLAAGVLLAAVAVFDQGDDVDPIPSFPEQGSDPGGRRVLDGAG